MQIDDTALKTIVAKAIFDGITPEQRQELITRAINTLLTVPLDTGYGGRKQPTPLQSLFEHEVQNLAREVIRERFQTDPALKTVIEGITTKAIQTIAANDEIAAQMAKLIAGALNRAERAMND